MNETVCSQCLGRNGRHNADCVHRIAQSGVDVVTLLGKEQHSIDERRKVQAQGIIDAAKLDAVTEPYGDALTRAKALARGWIVTALQAAANEAYMHDSRDQARAELAATTAVLARVTRDNVELAAHLTDVQKRGSSLMVELQDAKAQLAQLRRAETSCLVSRCVSGRHIARLTGVLFQGPPATPWVEATDGDRADPRWEGLPLGRCGMCADTPLASGTAADADALHARLNKSRE